MPIVGPSGIPSTYTAATLDRASTRLGVVQVGIVLVAIVIVRVE